MTGWNWKWTALFLFLAFVVLWQLLYYIASIDRRYSSPFLVLLILGDASFLRGVGIMLLQCVVTFLIGWLVGKIVGSLILRNSWLTSSTTRFLRIGMWIPFIIYWPLPIWNPWKLGPYETFLTVSLVSASAVALSTLRNYLISQSILGLQWQDARWRLAKASVLQALFISVFSQLWLFPYGWRWYLFGVEGAYAASIVLLLVVFIVERLFRASFDDISSVHGTTLVKELGNAKWNTWAGSMVIALSLIFIWQVLSMSGLDATFSSPLTVVSVGYHLLTRSTIWTDLYVSLSEIFTGVVLGGGAALVTYRILLARDAIRNCLFPILPLAFVTPIFSPVIAMEWLGRVGYLQKGGGIGLVIFFPFLQALWGLRDRPLGLRVLLGVDDALPYAFVVMLFAEAMAATAGVGFSMLKAHVDGDIVPEGIAVALVTIALLVALSSTLRWVAKRLYFPGEN